MGFPWRCAPAVQSSHALFLIDGRKPEMVSGLRAEGEFIMTNIVILTGRIARDPETRETKSGTSVTARKSRSYTYSQEATGRPWRGEAR